MVPAIYRRLHQVRAYIVCKWKLKQKMKQVVVVRGELTLFIGLLKTIHSLTLTHSRHRTLLAQSQSLQRLACVAFAVSRVEHIIPVVDLLQHCAPSIHWVSARIISWKLSIYIRIQTLFRNSTLSQREIHIAAHAAGFCDKINVQINFHSKIRKWATDTPAGMAHAVCISQTQ